MAWQSMERSLGDPCHSTITTIIRAGRPFSDTSSGHKCCKKYPKGLEVLHLEMLWLTSCETTCNHSRLHRTTRMVLRWKILWIHPDPCNGERCFMYAKICRGQCPFLRPHALKWTIWTGKREGYLCNDMLLYLKRINQLAHRKGIEKDSESTFNSWISGYPWSWKHIWDQSAVMSLPIDILTASSYARCGSSRTPGICIPHDAPFSKTTDILCYTFFSVTPQKLNRED